MQIQGKFYSVLKSPIGDLALFVNKNKQITDVRHVTIYIYDESTIDYTYGERPVKTEIFDNSGESTAVDPYYELVGQPIENVL